jgi:hypothetical protein
MVYPPGNQEANGLLLACPTLTDDLPYNHRVLVPSPPVRGDSNLVEDHTGHGPGRVGEDLRLGQLVGEVYVAPVLGLGEVLVMGLAVSIFDRL